MAEVAHSFFKAAKSLEADEMVALGHVTLSLLPDEPRVQEEGRCIKALHELQDWGISLLPSDYYQVCTPTPSAVHLMYTLDGHLTWLLP